MKFKLRQGTNDLSIVAAEEVVRFDEKNSDLARELFDELNEILRKYVTRKNKNG